MKSSGQQFKVYSHMRAAGFNVDVSIASLYFTMGGIAGMTQRKKQQRVGSVVSRLNVTLREQGFKIVPGTLKKTYRLTAHVPE